VRVAQLYDILVRPVFSEKASLISGDGKYVFEILKSANKKQVAAAIEQAFSVKVAKVNMVNIPPKRKIFKQVKGVRSGFKKAIVTLRSGFTLDLMAS
jgi:large subunit ribosomal protein L23